MKLGAFLCLGLRVTAGSSFGQALPERGPLLFQPKLSIGAPPTQLYRDMWLDSKKPASHPVVKHSPVQSAEKPADPEVVCGMRVIRKGPEQDPGIIVKPSDSTRAAIRRITPPVCGSRR